MSSDTLATATRIALLDNRLANQIAAGEVVERPASVVKELLENSLDAGASRIEVDIERGGTRLIRITDNGKGIHGDDLALALTRHATSKIKSTDDLANIQSLGFRGEALASIASVSRLTLTSRQIGSELAWQASAQGRQMAVDIQPAAASVGTRIEVADLFFNTPARQKFMRTEKTEFSHIEEVFKRHALANFDVAFLLKHNHKIVKRVPAFGDPSQWSKRIASICGKAFADAAVEFECQHEAVRIWGWLGLPAFHRSESDIQYLFINRRPVKDKTLNHAIRQAYDGLLPAGRMATFVVFLEIDPRQVDVNVHPTKHEVRFSEQRLVHDLLAKVVREKLLERQQPTLIQSSEQQAESQPRQAAAGDPESQNNYTMQQNRLDIVESSRPGNNIAEELVQGYLQQQEPQVPEATEHTRVASKRKLPAYSRVAIDASLKALDATTANEETGRLTQRQDAIPAAVSRPLPAVDNELVPLVKVNDLVYITELNGEAYSFNSEVLFAQWLLQVLNGDACEFAGAASTSVAILRGRPLLFPRTIKVSHLTLEDFRIHQFMQASGFDFEVVSAGDESTAAGFLLRALPQWMDSIESEQAEAMLVQWLGLIEKDASPEHIAGVISQNLDCLNKSALIAILSVLAKSGSLIPALSAISAQQLQL